MTKTVYEVVKDAVCNKTKEKRINYQKIANIDGEVDFTYWYEVEQHVLSNPSDMSDVKDVIIEIMKKNNIITLKATKFGLNE